MTKLVDSWAWLFELSWGIQLLNLSKSILAKWSETLEKGWLSDVLSPSRAITTINWVSKIEGKTWENSKKKIMVDHLNCPQLGDHPPVFRPIFGGSSQPRPAQLWSSARSPAAVHRLRFPAKFSVVSTGHFCRRRPQWKWSLGNQSSYGVLWSYRRGKSNWNKLDINWGH